MSMNDAKQQPSLDDTLKESAYYMEDTSEYNKSNREAFKEYLRRHQDELRNKRNFHKGNFTSRTFKLSPVSRDFRNVTKHAHPNLYACQIIQQKITTNLCLETTNIPHSRNG